MQIKPFGVEMWMNEFETKCELNLAETCVDSITLGELLDMAGKRETVLDELLPLRLGYGDIEGSPRLRDVIAGLYAKQTRDNVLVCHGTIGANALVHQALVSRGDHVIAVVPTYQQHYSIPESLGGLLVVGVLGFALNDSGIAVPGVMIGVVNAALVYLAVRGLPPTAPDEPSAVTRT